MHVVLDTNVLVSALLWPGPSNKILKLVENKNITLCLNEFLLKELVSVLRRPKFRKRLIECNTTVEEITTGILEICKIFPITEHPRVVDEDPDDNWVFACAITSASVFIISGDAHLLKIGKYRNISILTPRQFISSVRI